MAMLVYWGVAVAWDASTPSQGDNPIYRWFVSTKSLGTQGVSFGKHGPNTNEKVTSVFRIKRSCSFFLQCYNISCIHFCIVLSTWPPTPKDSQIEMFHKFHLRLMAFPNLQSLVSFVFNMVINNNFKTYPGAEPPRRRHGLEDAFFVNFFVGKGWGNSTRKLFVCLCVRFLSGTDHSQTTLQAVSAAPISCWVPQRFL